MVDFGEQVRFQHVWTNGTNTFKISTYGGGKSAMHLQLEINGVFVHDTSGNPEYHFGQMFKNDLNLMNWIAEIVAYDKQAYKDGRRL